jgi:4-hydroxy-2-oxoheptanedioate aldolase
MIDDEHFIRTSTVEQGESMIGFPAALTALSCAALLTVKAPAQPAPPGAPAPKLYNTVKQKLLEGRQVFSFTQSKLDIAGYCEAAKHYDYAWIEMQHSTLEFKDAEAMIGACPHAGAIPMIRLPDAQEWHIQHATDIGALGVIIPTVDDADRAREAARWARYPPVARRSSGQGQARAIWGINGIDYAKTFNDNMLVVVMIETPTGVANAYDIASVPGIDVVIVGNNDLSVFSGFSQDDDRYQAMVKKIHDDTLRAGKIFGQANATYAKGHPLSGNSKFFQNGPSQDGWKPAGARDPSAPPPGEETKRSQPARRQ